jgi:hypothetical protein
MKALQPLQMTEIQPTSNLLVYYYNDQVSELLNMTGEELNSFLIAQLDGSDFEDFDKIECLDDAYMAVARHTNLVVDVYYAKF